MLIVLLTLAFAAPDLGDSTTPRAPIPPSAAPVDAPAPQPHAASGPAIAAHPVGPPGSSLTVAQLAELAAEQRRIERRGMGLLLTWAVGNLAVGTPASFVATTERGRAFWQGNALWNVVNLGIAGSALIQDRRAPPLDYAEVLHRTRSLDRALLVNIGLDVAYLMAGWALHERASRIGDARFAGWGDALLLQGGFLLGFDVALFVAHQRPGRRLRGRRAP